MSEERVAETRGLGRAAALVIADLGNYRVRVVAARTGTFYGQAMTVGDVYTVAGTGAPGYSGDGGGHPGRAEQPRRGGAWTAPATCS